MIDGFGTTDGQRDSIHILRGLSSTLTGQYRRGVSRITGYHTVADGEGTLVSFHWDRLIVYLGLPDPLQRRVGQDRAGLDWAGRADFLSLIVLVRQPHPLTHIPYAFCIALGSGISQSLVSISSLSLSLCLIRVFWAVSVPGMNDKQCDQAILSCLVESADVCLFGYENEHGGRMAPIEILFWDCFRFLVSHGTYRQTDRCADIYTQHRYRSHHQRCKQAERTWGITH